MRIKMIKIMCGPGGNHHPGAVRDVEDDEAMALVLAGAAEVVATPRAAAVEVSAPPAPETRSKIRKGG